MIVGALVLMTLSLVIASWTIDEPLRRYIEAQATSSLDGYGVTIGGLDFHPLGLSLDLENVSLFRSENPQDPIVHLPHWSASIHWRQLLRGNLVSDHQFQEPRVSVTRGQAEREIEDPQPLSERGWQDAVAAIYPVRIHHLVIRNGAFTYVDAPDATPLEFLDIDASAENISNVSTPEQDYPSTFTFDSRVFKTGHLHLEGRADFLAKPIAGLDFDFNLRDAPLGGLLPVSTRFDMPVGGGSLTVQGYVEYSPWARHVICRDLQIDALRLDYVYERNHPPSKRSGGRQEPQPARDAAAEPPMRIEIQSARLTGAELGFADRSTSPPYRLFVSDLAMKLEGFSNAPGAGTAELSMTGRFMGHGKLSVRGVFHPASTTPDFQLAAKIVKTQLPSLNDLLRAHTAVDVEGGMFALFSEITVRKGRMDGYIKPLFKDVDVYDPAQDKDQGVFQQVYEGMVGGLADLLKNQPRDEVATETDVSGPLADPRMSTWDVVIHLIKNAFYEAILPGFRQHAQRA